MPEIQGRRSSRCSAPPSRAAVRNPFWPWPMLTNAAGKAVASNSGLGPRQDRAHRGEIGGEACCYPDRKTQRIGECRDRKCDSKEEWWIVPPEERHLAAAKRSLLRPMLEGRLIGGLRASLPGQRPSRVHVGKIGAERLAVAIDQAVRHHDPARKHDDADPEQQQAVVAGTHRRQPYAGSQPLPDMSHFAAEFYECCAESSPRLLTFPEVCPLFSKLLAMQRDPL